MWIIASSSPTLSSRNFISTPDRFNDTNIMNGVNQKIILWNKIARFNAYQMYLRFTFRSKICNIAGTIINDNMI